MTRLFRVKEVAELAAISERSVYRLAELGELPCVRIGRSVRFRQPDVERLIGAPITEEEPPAPTRPIPDEVWDFLEGRG
jgi:excisionase family DNA binding protein